MNDRRWKWRAAELFVTRYGAITVTHVLFLITRIDGKVYKVSFGWPEEHKRS